MFGRFASFAVFALVSSIASSQAVRVEWWRNYSLGATSALENLAGVAYLSDNAVAAVGTSGIGGANGDDIVTSVYRATTGEFIWRKTWNGGASDIGKAIAFDSAGNVFVVGRRGTVDGGDFIVLKYDKNGVERFWRQVNSGYGADDPLKILIGTDGNPIIVGSCGPTGRRRTYAFALNGSDLSVRWTQVYDYGNGTSTETRDAHLGAANALYLTGMSSPVPSVGGSRLFLHRYNPGPGTLTWTRWVQRSPGFGTAGTHIASNSSTLYVAGMAVDQQAGNVSLLQRINPTTGAVIWTMSEVSIPYSGLHEDGRSLVALDLAGNPFWVSPINGGSGRQRDLAVRGVTPAGAYRWQTSFNSGTNASDTPIDLTTDAAGRAYILNRVQFPNQNAKSGVVSMNTVGTLRWFLYLNLSLTFPQDPSAFAFDPASGDLAVSMPFYRSSSNSPIAGLWRQAPEAVNNAYIVKNNGLTRLGALANDRYTRDASISISQQPSSGTVTVNPDRTLTYSPNAGFVGKVTFKYRLTKSNLTLSDATVTLTVQNP